MVGLNGIALFAAEGDAYPPLVDVIFQMMFAAITPAIISGAFAERKKFSAFFIFSLLWITFVYCPIAHFHQTPRKPSETYPVPIM